MYPKLFIENFWLSDQEDRLFVCMPFGGAFDAKFKEIIEPVGKKLFKEVKRSDTSYAANDIPHQILDGIANSKMLLFDLSDQRASERKINDNVLYELGIATTIRDKEDILLIREGDRINPAEFPFDIRSLNIIPHGKRFKKKWLEKILDQLLEEQSWIKNKRIETASRSIDGEGLELMYKFGRLPKGYDHFNTRTMRIEYKVSVLRLLDLGIISCESVCYKRGYEYAYHWTSFGRAVMQYLGIEKISVDEFKKLPEYQERLDFEEKYRNFKREVNR